MKRQWASVVCRFGKACREARRSTCSHGVFKPLVYESFQNSILPDKAQPIQSVYVRRFYQHATSVIHEPPPCRPKRRQVKCAGTWTLRQYFCASCGEVSLVRYRRIVIRVGWARRTAAPCFASCGRHQKNGRRHRGKSRCRLHGKGDGRGAYRSHVPSSSSLASRVSGKTSRRPMCFTSNFLFRAAKWRSP